MSIENSYAESPENYYIIVDDEGDVVKFNNRFTYLGSIIDFSLVDTVDSESRVPKDSKYMGALRFIWEDENMALIIKVKLCNASPLNLILWGGENWSGNASDINEWEAFQHKEMRKILKISMARVNDDSIRNKTIRKYSLNEPSIENT